MEAVLADALGPEAALSKSTVAAVCTAIRDEFDAWHHFLTDLTDLTNLADRGLVSPLPVISDGAKGLISAAEQVFPRSLPQRCTIHKLRNVLTKISKDDQDTVRADFWACFDTSDDQVKDIEPGQQLVEAVQRRIDAFITTWAGTYPAAMWVMEVEEESKLSRSGAWDGAFAVRAIGRLHSPGRARPQAGGRSQS
ncbi:transposase [Streptomyces sp. NPDC058572]|uniref:transposase n=1 Tax=Streptomyces sp. NPDC058572 TaxID=3346546 RepID=UPI00364AD30B